jgi:hypothetical protein
VVPVTSNITRIYPFQLLLPAHLTGLPRDAKAQAEQIRSVSVDRVAGLLGQLPPGLVTELDRALRVQLSLLADVTATLTAAAWSSRKRPRTRTTSGPGNGSPPSTARARCRLPGKGRIFRSGARIIRSTGLPGTTAPSRLPVAHLCRNTGI